MAMSTAKKGGAIKANSTAVVPPRQRQKRATALARRRKCLDKSRNMAGGSLFAAGSARNEVEPAASFILATH